MAFEEKSKLNEEKLKEKARKVSIYEGSAYAVMDGFGYRYVSPYANNLLKSNAMHMGLLSSLPGLFSSLSELLSLRFIEKYSRKKIVFMGTLFQALMWIPLIILGILFVDNKSNRTLFPWLLIIIYILLISFGAFGRPAWSSWMRDLTVKNTYAFFGKRNRIVGGIALICFFIAAFILDSYGRAFIGFAIIFSIAFFGRFISSILFIKQYEPKIKLNKGYYFSFRDFVREMPHRNFGNYVLFSSIITFAVAIASPFFIVYMLNYLHFSYVRYMIIVLCSALISLIFMSFWGKIGYKFGNVKIMKICGSLTFIVPLLWYLSSLLFKNESIYLFIFLIFTEIISGFVWSGFNLSSSTFAYHAVTRERMALCVAYERFTASFGALLGALLGGWIASFKGNIFGMSPILFVFLLSAVLRILFFSIFIKRFKEVRKVDNNFSMKRFVYSLPRQTLVGMGIKRFGHPTHEH